MLTEETLEATKLVINILIINFSTGIRQLYWRTHCTVNLETK